MSEYQPLYRRLSFVVVLFAVSVGPLLAQERDYTDELVKEAIAIGLKSTTKENLSSLRNSCIDFPTPEQDARFGVLTAKIMFYETVKKPPSSKLLLEIIQTKSKDDAISGPCGNISMALWLFNVTDEFGRPSKEIIEQCYANNRDWSIRSGCVPLLFRIDKQAGREKANLIMNDSNIPLRQKFSLIAPLYQFGYRGGYQIMADALVSPDPGIRLQLPGMMYYFEKHNGKEYARGIIDTKKLVADALKQLESMQSQLKKNQKAQAARAKRAADRISAAKVEAPVAAPAETRSVKSAKSPSPAAANLLALKPQQTPPPAKKAKKAGTFSQVTSLAELRALTPARTATDWELRIAWADSGIENAPWKLLYVHCLYTGDKKARNRKSVEYWGYHQREYALGSIGWDMHYAPPGMLAMRSRVHVNRSTMIELGAASTERLYCAVVLTPLAGSYEVRVGGREPVIANISVKKAPDLSWTPLLKPRPAGAKDDGVPLNMTDEFLAAGPAGKESPIFFHSGTSRARGEQKLFAKTLPGQFPGIAGWRLYEMDGQMLGFLERMTPLQINAEISGGKLLLRGKGFTPYRPDLQFLAQWRINDKLVTAPPPEVSDERAQQMAELELKLKKTPEEFTVKIPLALPAWLARRVKAGDKVSLTVLYSPSRWRQIRHPSVKMAEEMVLEEEYGCRQPVMSKPVTFTVTKAMLAKARAAAKASSPPATRPAKKTADAGV